MVKGLTVADFPELVAQWHPTKNKITPKDVAAGSSKKYWWICLKGLKDHQWQARCGDRTGNNKSGCPFCSNQKVCHSNCLATCFPEIAKEWHPTKNGNVTPKDVIPGSDKKYWWKCSTGLEDHEWQARCGDRTGNNKSGCPFCSNQKACYSNCLATHFPKIAKEWHPTKNGNITPNDVIPGSDKKYWWKCPTGLKDHEWQASCDKRTGHDKTDCPYCSNQKVCHDNCLATCFPDIAKEWHPIKNGNITPKDVIPGSDKKYWWRCSKDHEWEARCNDRTGVNKCGCPTCLSSKGEVRISEFLDHIGYEYTRQKKYPSCKKIKPLPFDFHVSYKKSSEVLIEYHGKQHYVPCHFGSKKDKAAMKNFISTVKRDCIKETWCKCSKKRLLVIPYWDYDRIEEILTCFFTGKKVVFSDPPKQVKKYALKRENIFKKLAESLRSKVLVM